MKFWQLEVDVDQYAHLAFVDEAMTRRLIGEFMGKPFSGRWEEVQVYCPKEWEEPGWSIKERKMIKAQREGRPIGDFVYLVGAEGAVILRDKALTILQPLIEGSVEILPLRYGGERLHLINVINVIDCLDEEKSTVKRLPDGMIWRFVEAAFKEDLLEGEHIFKLPGPQVFIFVSELFMKKVEENGLKGLLWKP